MTQLSIMIEAQDGVQLGALEETWSGGGGAGLRGVVSVRPLHQPTTAQQKLAGDDRWLSYLAENSGRIQVRAAGRADFVP